MRVSLFALVVLVLAACGGTKHVDSAGFGATELVIFPAPPDTPRVQFLARFGTAADIETPESPSFFEQLVGSDTRDTVASIVKPYGIGIHGGKVLVCDTGRDAIDVIDLNLKTFSVLRPTGYGSLQKPVNCSVDPTDGYIYVSDTGRGDVVVLGPMGEFSDAIAVDGGTISDVAIDSTTIWLLDLDGKQVVAFDKRTRQEIRRFPGSDAGADEALAFPVSIAVHGDEVFVVDQMQFKVQVYSRDGEYRRSFGSAGRGAGQFTRPKGIAVDRAGVVYVVDAAFENVQMFNADGQLLMHFGGAYQGPGYMYLPAQVTIDYDNLSYFEQFVDPSLTLKHLIIVTNQSGPDKVTVYGFVEPR